MPTNVNIPFSRSPLDPVKSQRTPAHIQSFLNASTASFIVLHKDKIALDKDRRLKRSSLSIIESKPKEIGEMVFLGLEGHDPVFAIGVDDPVGDFPDCEFYNLKSIASQLTATELAFAGQAKSLLDWHLNHRFCTNCGTAINSFLGGIRRKCSLCDLEVLPRINPVVIMVIQHNNKILLARGKNWPPGAMSTPAGFVSSGETLEEAAAREVYEEVGLTVKNLQYVFSQPWPFGGQLMLGVICDADSAKLSIDVNEIEEARWFTRAEVRSVLFSDADAFELHHNNGEKEFSKDVKFFRRPPEFAVSYHLLRYWLDQ